MQLFKLLSSKNIELIIKGKPLTITLKKGLAEVTYEINDSQEFYNNFFEIVYKHLIDFISMTEN